MMKDKGKDGLAVMIGLGKLKKGKPDPDQDAASDNESDSEVSPKEAAQDLLDAIDSKDASKVADAFQTMLDVCDSD